MNSVFAAILADMATAETGMDARTVHLRRGYDGWAVCVYLDDADADPVVISQKDGREGYEMTAFGATDDGYAPSLDALFRDLRSRRSWHAAVPLRLGAEPPTNRGAR